MTVENVWLTRIYVLFFISLERRRIEYVACTSNPDGGWVAQQARNLLMTLGDRQRPFRFLLHDRDIKFSGGFDAVFQSEGIRLIRTPIWAPNANAHAEDARVPWSARATVAIENPRSRSGCQEDVLDCRAAGFVDCGGCWPRRRGGLSYMARRTPFMPASAWPGIVQMYG